MMSVCNRTCRRLGRERVGKLRILTLDAKSLLDLSSAVNGLLVAVVPNGDVGARFGIAFGDGKANTGTGAGDDGGFALQ